MPEDEATVATETEKEQQPAAETAETEVQPEAAEGETAEAQEPEKEPEPVVPRSQFNETAYRLRKANEQLKKLQTQPMQAEPSPQPYPFSAPEPKWEQFEQPEEYVRAHHGWATSKLEHQRAVNEQVAAMTELAQARAKYGQEKLHEGTTKYPDFIEVLDKAGLRTNDYTEMVDAILDSDNFPDLAYYLANNRAELTRISQLSDKAQIRELGKLEARIVATQTLKEKQKIQPTKVEGAGGGPRAKAEIDPHKEFEKFRANPGIDAAAEYIRKTKKTW